MINDCKGGSGAKRACQGSKSIMNALGGPKDHPSTASGRTSTGVALRAHAKYEL